MPDPDDLPLQTAIKYNPHLWSEDELRAVFVARGRELSAILDRIRSTEFGKVPQHLLITGYRGMGKTTLLRRIALAVADEPELDSEWIALTFPEEQYTVSTLAELWMNVLDALADTLERKGAPPDALVRLDGDIQALLALDPGEREAAALELLQTWITEHQRRVLLLIDRSDLLFGALGRGGAKRGKIGSDAGATPLWRLRKTLSHFPGIFWLGASYQTLESDHQYSDAFHDFFEIAELRPLSLDEMRKAMLALARTFGAGRGLRGEAAEQEMQRGLDARPERLKSLRALTGGNPRTTVTLYELFAAGWQGNVHSDLKALLDLMTPIYKARMEHLAEQPRKLLAHLMEHWTPIGTGELAQASGIPATTVSGQLTRLEAEGLVEKTPLAGTRRSGYQISERFFNVWYLMRYTPRRVRQRLTWLVEFMRLWFSADDQQRLARHQDDWTARLYRKAIELEPANALPWYNLGNLLQGHLERYEEAEAAYRKAIDLDPKDAAPWVALANLLHDQLGRRDEAESTYRQAVTLDPQDPYPLANLARLLAGCGVKGEADTLYRRAAGLAAELVGEGPSIGYLDLVLQAQLWLMNLDAAGLALARLAKAAAAGDSVALFKIQEQARECHAMGRGSMLADLVDASEFADLLRPIGLALRAAHSGSEAFDGIPAEIRSMAEESLADIQRRP